MLLAVLPLRLLPVLPPPPGVPACTATGTALCTPWLDPRYADSFQPPEAQAHQDICCCECRLHNFQPRDWATRCAEVHPNPAKPAARQCLCSSPCCSAVRATNAWTTTHCAAPNITKTWLSVMRSRSYPPGPSQHLALQVQWACACCCREFPLAVPAPRTAQHSIITAQDPSLLLKPAHLSTVWPTGALCITPLGCCCRRCCCLGSWLVVQHAV